MKRTFLVVDDHDLYRTSFCSLLKLCCPSAQVVEAANASQALALFPQHQWDAIILDYQLPTLSGSDVARHLRAQARAHNRTLPPLILMSTHPDAATFARTIGAAAFLSKPVEPADLQRVLEMLPAAPAAHAAPAPPTQVQLPRAPVTAARAAIESSARVTQLRNEILLLLRQTMRRFPPPHPPARTHPTGAPNARLGDYLVHLGYLTSDQLASVVQLHTALPLRSRVPLGFTVVARDLVPAPVVSAVLLQQFRERLLHNPATAPRFIGERLLLQAQLTPAQLAWALQEQLDWQRAGQWVRLGEIIVRHGWRDAPQPEELADAIATQL